MIPKNSPVKRRFLGERSGNYHATPLVGEMNATMEIGNLFQIEREVELEIFFKRPPTGVTYLPESVHEEPVVSNTQATERNEKICNQQLKVTWQNR